MSTGIGFRTYLFGIYLKMDIAWTTTLDHWASPQYIFSFGEDFLMQGERMKGFSGA